MAAVTGPGSWPSLERKDYTFGSQASASDTGRVPCIDMIMSRWCCVLLGADGSASRCVDLSAYCKSGEEVITDLLLCFLDNMFVAWQWAVGILTPLTQVFFLKQGAEIPLALPPSVLAPSLDRHFGQLSLSCPLPGWRCLVWTNQFCRTALPAARPSKSPSGLVGPEERQRTLPPTKAPQRCRRPWSRGKPAGLPRDSSTLQPSFQDLPSEQMPSAWGNLPIIRQTCQSQGMMMAGRTPAKRQLPQRHQRSSSFPKQEPTPESLETKWALQAGIGFLLFLEKADRLQLWQGSPQHEWSIFSVFLLNIWFHVIFFLQ